MQASDFLPKIATILQSVFLNIYNCVWKLAFLKSGHVAVIVISHDNYIYMLAVYNICMINVD